MELDTDKNGCIILLVFANIMVTLGGFEKKEISLHNQVFMQVY